jgi:tetratricopeptide (TPR) repeat protein
VNPYEILQVQPGASADEIKSAYHRLSAQWHPDNFTGAERLQAALRVRELAEAFTMLKDVEPGAGTRSGTQYPDPGGPAHSIQLQSAAEVDAAMGQGPDDPFSKAKHCFETGRLDAALEQIQAALLINPDKHDHHSLHAKILQAKGGDHRALVAALEQCLALDKKDFDSAIMLAQTYQNHGMHTRATRYWEWAYNLNPDHPFFVKEKTGAKEKVLETAQDLTGSLHGMLEGAKGLFKFGKGSK